VKRKLVDASGHPVIAGRFFWYCLRRGRSGCATIDLFCETETEELRGESIFDPTVDVPVELPWHRDAPFEKQPSR
jgi:hypothetical protein